MLSGGEEDSPSKRGFACKAPRAGSHITPQPRFFLSARDYGPYLGSPAGLMEARQRDGGVALRGNVVIAT